VRELIANTAGLNGDGRADYIVDESRTMDVLLSRDCCHTDGRPTAERRPAPRF
jgi:hypothetical protein